MTKQPEIRPRRSALYVPGSNARALDKARGLDADVLILDLEDGVAPDRKEEARAQVLAALAQGGYDAELVVRINHPAMAVSRARRRRRRRSCDWSRRWPRVAGSPTAPPCCRDISVPPSRAMPSPRPSATSGRQTPARSGCWTR